ncbi:hypothetical protein ACLB2K_013408 [Fragaria x ananassa]
MSREMKFFEGSFITFWLVANVERNKVAAFPSCLMLRRQRVATRGGYAAFLGRHVEAGWLAVAAVRQMRRSGSLSSKPRVAAMEDGQEVSETMSESSSGKIQETRDEMLSRHRKETSKLQDKEIQLKKAAAKGSKAEQKAKKKQVEEEISRLSAELKEKQAEELALLGYSSSNNGGEKSNLDTLVKAIAGVSISSQPESAKPSKSSKRKVKRAQEDAAREQRIQEEQNNLDQLARHSRGSSPYTYQELREMVAAYMRKHAPDFLPFFLSDNQVDGDSNESLAERFENYCKEVESTAAWGGQLELGALSHCLKKPIMVYSGSFPDVEMGSGNSIRLWYDLWLLPQALIDFALPYAVIDENAMVFESGSVLPVCFKNLIWDYAIEWKKAKLKSNENSMFSFTMLSWKMPPENFFKLNDDGIRTSPSGKIGVGGVTRNHCGDWIIGFQINLGVCDILDVEAWGLFHGLKLAIDLDITISET